jgi:hypothetical protein
LVLRNTVCFFVIYFVYFSNYNSAHNKLIYNVIYKWSIERKIIYYIGSKSQLRIRLRCVDKAADSTNIYKHYSSESVRRPLSSPQLATGAATQVVGLLGAAAGSLSHTANSRRARRWARVMSGDQTDPPNATGRRTNLVACVLARLLGGAPGEARTGTDRTGVSGHSSRINSTRTTGRSLPTGTRDESLSAASDPSEASDAIASKNMFRTTRPTRAEASGATGAARGTPVTARIKVADELTIRGEASGVPGGLTG